MNYQDLRDHIKGSHLMKHNLEAFFIQSAYVEGIFKIYADFSLFSETGGKSYENKLLMAIKKDLEKYSFANLIDLLKRANLLPEEQKQNLDDYRKKRNQVIHDLLSKVADSNFENELISAYEIGEKIMNAEKFKQIEIMLDDIEKKVSEKQKPENLITEKAPTSNQ